jgi:flagellar protein FlgJ
MNQSDSRVRQLSESATSAVSVEEREKLKKLSQEFESVFLDLVMQSMRKTIQKSELTDGGAGEEVFRSMLDQEYSKIISQQNLTGIAGTIEKDLLKLLEVQNSTNNAMDGRKSYGVQGLQNPAKRATID